MGSQESQTEIAMDEEALPLSGEEGSKVGLSVVGLIQDSSAQFSQVAHAYCSCGSSNTWVA